MKNIKKKENWQNQNKKLVYTTLVCSDNYLYGAIGLALSLKYTGAKYPLIVIVTDNVTNYKELDKFNIKYYLVPYCETGNKKDYSFTINKLYAFNLIEYDKFLFLDADLICYNNLDYILEEQNPYYFVAHIPFESYHKWSKIWGGLFAAIPEPGFINEYISNPNFIDDEDIFTQRFYNSTYFPYFHKNNIDWGFFHDNDMPHFQIEMKYWNRENLNTPEKIEKYIKDFLSNESWKY